MLSKSKEVQTIIDTIKTTVKTKGSFKTSYPNPEQEDDFYQAVAHFVDEGYSVNQTKQHITISVYPNKKFLSTPIQKRSYAECVKAIEFAIENIVYVPDKYLSKCYGLVAKSRWFTQHLPDTKLSEATILKAVKEYKKTLSV